MKARFERAAEDGGYAYVGVSSTLDGVVLVHGPSDDKKKRLAAISKEQSKTRERAKGKACSEDHYDEEDKSDSSSGTSMEEGSDNEDNGIPITIMSTAISQYTFTKTPTNGEATQLNSIAWKGIPISNHLATTC
ncbi:hypothetical protein A0O28_0096420 [Trichoderma guizhouense]|uniref:Uncharacterized protein n=1 Tax=Trichoderma guizhouense TaxID=1491466 RepID=A0A1T3CFQ4_9HYPO|nr:hypothetical protein A0O28_0096420 [Trichoderma guizhouense]